MFTDPTGTFQHRDEHLKQGILSMIRKARHTIEIHGFSLAGFYDEEIFDQPLVHQLKRGIKLSVFGNSGKEVRYIQSIYREYQPLCYRWADENAPDKSIYHVKAVVIDGLYLYIGSANLSKNALENSSEVGLFVEDHKLAQQIEDFTSHLIEKRFLVVVD